MLNEWGLRVHICCCSALLLLTWLEPQVWCHLPPRRPLPQQQMPVHTATKVLPKPQRGHPASQQEALPSHSAGRTWGESSNLHVTPAVARCFVITVLALHGVYQNAFHVETPEPRSGRLTAKPSGKFWMPIPMAKFLREHKKKATVSLGPLLLTLNISNRQKNMLKETDNEHLN